MSSLTGQDATAVATQGIYNGCSLTKSLTQGAHGVLPGTWLMATEETGANRTHNEDALNATSTRTIIMTIEICKGHLRVRINRCRSEWDERPDDIKQLTSGGAVPLSRI